MGFRFLGTTLAVLTLAACSSQPQKPSAGAPTATAPPAATATAANLAPAAASGATGAAAPNAPVLNRKLVTAGYKATTIKGEVYYCRMEDVTNTNFKRKVCLNEAQLKDQERATKEMQDRMMRQQANPGCNGPCS